MTIKRTVLAAFAALFTLTSLHAGRETRDLTAGWKFLREDAPLTASTDSWTKVTVPHTWNALDAQKGKQGNPGLKDGYYRGACWYALTMDVPADWKDRRIFVRFEAASIIAKTYFNGEFLGEHRGAFTAFCHELTPYLRYGEKNELRVQVDNTWTPGVPPISGDFNMNGGLYRPVQLIVTDSACISPLDFASPGVYVTTKSIRNSAAKVEVKTVVSYTTANAGNLQLETVIGDAAGKTVARSRLPVKAGDDGTVTITSTSTIPQSRRWEGRRDPYLYSAIVRLYRNSKPVDEVTQTFGIRTVEISQDRGFLLNGRPYPIYGVNRHQDRFNQGWALTPENHEEDAQLMLEMGVTAVRNAHYPQSRAWHDLADRNGLLMWDEVSLVDMITDSPEFTANARLQLSELIHQLYNHPCIAFWGLFNELDNKKTPDPMPLLTLLKEDVLAMDKTRIIVGASNHTNKAYNQLPGAICFNTYPGWYGGKITDMPDKISTFYREFGDRRIALSEYGAGANPGQHMEGAPKLEKANAPFHPEEWQSLVHEGDYAAIKDNAKLWGSFLWVMFDFPAAHRKEGGKVGLNDKGVVTQDRLIKKDAFYFYKANWNDQPMVYIAARRMTPRRQAMTDVKVYSNCTDVELRVNGKPLPAVSKDKTNVFRWENTVLQPGRNLIEATGKSDGKTVTDQCEWLLENAPEQSPSPAAQ